MTGLALLAALWSSPAAAIVPRDAEREIVELYGPVRYPQTIFLRGNGLVEVNGEVVGFRPFSSDQVLIRRYYREVILTPPETARLQRQRELQGVAGLVLFNAALTSFTVSAVNVGTGMRPSANAPWWAATAMFSAGMTLSLALVPTRRQISDSYGRWALDNPQHVRIRD